MTDHGQASQEIGPYFVAYRRQETLTVEIDGEAIVYDESQEVAHLLSPTAAIVWEQLDGRNRLDKVATGLAEAFDASTEQVLGDVLELVQEFARRGLLEGEV
jgi:hypothetical protein